MLELAKKTKASFLLASTSEVYGNPLMHPQSESYYGNVNPVGIRACYDESKRFAEALTMEYVRKHKLQARIIRIFNTFGPRMQATDGRVISNFVTAAIANKSLILYGGGQQTRSFCYVSDMVAGLIKAMEIPSAIGRVINLGNPEELTIKDIAQTILKLTRSSAPVISSPKKEDDPERRKPDISLARSLVGWKPEIPLIDGLKETINYFRNL